MHPIFLFVVLALLTAVAAAPALPADEETDAEFAEPGEGGIGTDFSVLPLTREDEVSLQAQRAVIEQYLTDAERKNYESVDGKLELIRRLLEKGMFSSQDVWELQCLGVILGDAIAMNPDMAWVAFEDEYGRDAALQLADTSIVLFPITMISKRIERGEEVDVHVLYEVVLEEVGRVLASGEYQ